MKLGTLLRQATTGMVAAAGLACVSVVGLAVATPAAAQNYSEGYKFLKAVEKREMRDALALLEKPGSTVVNARDITNGRTALHIAVSRRDLGWLSFLKERGANPNVRDNTGTTPLMMASQLGFIEGLQPLIDSGARVDEANDAGETPLILAVHRRDVAMIRTLLAAGSNADRADASGRSARDYAQASSGAIRSVFTQDTTQQAAEPAAPAQTYGPSF